jgi:hypothetical protein
VEYQMRVVSIVIICAALSEVTPQHALGDDTCADLEEGVSA